MDRPEDRPSAAAPPLERGEVEDGLRFMHILGMQSRLGLAEAEDRTLALIEALLHQGVLDAGLLQERLADVRARRQERPEQEATVRVAPSGDKYAMEGLPEIDCASRLHLCKARCCSFTFPLSFQDLDEGVVRWRYDQPYLIRQREDGACVHNCAETRRCTIHAQRPAICRAYDCRGDRRIWLDFDQRLPAPPEAP